MLGDVITGVLCAVLVITAAPIVWHVWRPARPRMGDGGLMAVADATREERTATDADFRAWEAEYRRQQRPAS